MAGVVAGAGAAVAADIVRPPAVPPAPARPVVVAPYAFNWSGPYIGVQGGWDNNEADDVEGFGPVTANGGTLGIFGGVNMQAAGPWVIGFDGSINWSNARGSDASDTVDFGPTWKGLLRGRVGIALDRVLLYGTLGGAVGHFTETANATDATAWGWTAGVGADWAITNTLFARVDWAHQNFGDFDLNPGFSASGVTSDTVTVGLGLKF